MPPKVSRKYTKSKNASKIVSSNLADAKYLFIVESPSKCAKIEHFLGGDYSCIASKGHFRTIDGLKSIDTNNTFQPKFSLIDEKKEHVEQMKKIISGFSSSNIYIATDDDREGEAIAWHICMQFDLPLKTTKRVLFHEVTKDAIQSCIKKPTIVNMNLVHAQHARQVLDILVGYKISPLLWKYLYYNNENSLSAGRCQSPALRLIYENHIEKTENIKEFNKINASFFPNKLLFNLTQHLESPDMVLQFLELSKGFKHILSVGDYKKSVREPPKPFHTSRLLQVASNVLHMSPKDTMNICQKLYQGGFITYMRTESTSYSKSYIEGVSKYIENRFNNKKYIGNIEKLENTDINNPHEAIRVTQISLSNLGNCEDRRMNTMYKLIWNNSIESCMSSAIYNVSHIKITAPLDNEYVHTIEIPSFLGWKKLGEGEPTNTENELTALRMNLINIANKGNPISYNTIKSETHIINKKRHYTEASLINKLEELGIGRPSTFATIVDTILERGYVKITDIEGKKIQCKEYELIGDQITITDIEKEFGGEKKKLVIEPVGILTIEFLLGYFENMFSYEYTKNMEYELDKVSCGELTDWTVICRNSVIDIDKQMENLTAIPKQSYEIDEDNVYIFGKDGPRIIHTEVDGTKTYLMAKEKIDLDKLRNKQYSINELIENTSKCIGKHCDIDLYIKNGRYGLYLEYGDNRISIKNLNKSVDDISFEDVQKYLEPVKEKQVLRVLNEYMDIRRGQYGPYVYYKKPDMKKPKFLNIKKCPHGYLNCTIETLVEWLCTTYKISM